MDKYFKGLSGLELVGAITTKIIEVDYKNISFNEARACLPPVDINYEYLSPEIQAGDSQYVMEGMAKRFNQLVSYLEKKEELRIDMEKVDPSIRHYFFDQDITGTTLLTLTAQNLLVILYSRRTKKFKLFLDHSIMEGVEGIKPLINEYTKALFYFKGVPMGDLIGSNHVITNLPEFVARTIHKDLEESLLKEKNEAIAKEELE